MSYNNSRGNGGQKRRAGGPPNSKGNYNNSKGAYKAPRPNSGGYSNNSNSYQEHQYDQNYTGYDNYDQNQQAQYPDQGQYYSQQGPPTGQAPYDQQQYDQQAYYNNAPPLGSAGDPNAPPSHDAYGYDNQYNQQQLPPQDYSQSGPTDPNAPHPDNAQYYDYTQAPPLPPQSQHQGQPDIAIPPGAPPIASVAPRDPRIASPPGSSGKVPPGIVPTDNHQPDPLQTPQLPLQGSPVVDQGVPQGEHPGTYLEYEHGDPNKFNTQLPPPPSPPPVSSQADMNFGDGPPGYVSIQKFNEVNEKLKVLRSNHSKLQEKYYKLRDSFKQEKLNSDGKIKYYAEKIEKLKSAPGAAGSVSTTPSRKPSTLGGDDNSSVTEPDVKPDQDKKIETLKKDLVKYKDEKTKAIEELQSVNNEFNAFKTKYLFLEKEKQDLILKIEELGGSRTDIQSSPKIKSLIFNDDDVDKLIDLDDHGADNVTSDLKMVWERKEYYKNLYYGMLRDKEQEQRAFLKVSQGLIDKYVLNNQGSKSRNGSFSLPRTTPMKK